MVVLALDGGPTLVLHPEHARALLQAQAPSSRGGPTGADTVVPARLAWPPAAAATRGTAPDRWGEARIAEFSVVPVRRRDPAADLLTAAVTRAVEARIDPGVYRLDADALTPLKGSGRKLHAVPLPPGGGPLLLLLHGSFEDTASTFGALWTQHAAEIRAVFERHAGAVYGVDHPTLTRSPIGNALDLVRTLPADARLHLLTHSRGGLVAEVLARACAPGAADDVLAAFDAPGMAAQKRDLRALIAEAQARRLSVERIVRVACPARGTLLASKRLDVYLSVLSWCLQLAGSAAASELVDLLHEVARRRADPAELPGLEAMLPESALVAWLDGAAEPIPGELRVVAGDLQGDSVASWTKTLVADAFFWTDNDLLVQTRSMYGGAARQGGARFLLDRGAAVSHFAYFGNDRTARAICAALTDDEPADFAPIGPLSWAGADAGGLRGAAPAAAAAAVRGPAPPAAAADRPAVFVLPGILGSNLAVDGERIWLGARFLNGLNALAWDPATDVRVTTDGPASDVYDALIAHLRDSHDVTVFAFDWRRPIEDEAHRLADAVEQALDARAAAGQPVRIVAHSMGGLVVRTMALERPATWRRLMDHDGARLLMLGTPNGGSWSPMQTLSGDDTFGNALTAFGSLFDNHGLRMTMAAMPGFIQLQAGLVDPALQLDRAETWTRLADDDVARLLERSRWHLEGPQQTIYRWGAPPQAVLDRAVALRKRLDVQAADLGADAGRMAMVVGRAAFTPGGIVLTDDGLEYVAAPGGGDGRVPLASALLPGVKTWVHPVSHGDLPAAVDAFPAYLDLLERGETQRLDPLDPAARAAAASSAVGPASGTVARGVGGASPPSTSRPSRGPLVPHPPARPADMLAGPSGPVPSTTPAGPPLRVSVLNCDLKFVHQALVIGHYRSLALTGTEAVVDRLVGGAMSKSLASGLYPEAVGTHQIFGNVRPDPDNVLAMARPLAAVVAGLGEEGKIGAIELASTVRLAALAYAQRLAEQADAPSDFELAATLIGSGGTGISAGSAALSIAQGAYEADLVLADNGWPRIGRLVLVELYLDRASDAWRALQVQSTAAASQLQLVGPVEAGAGALRRSLDPSYRGTAYDLISAVSSAGPGGAAAIVYNLDTSRARTEVRAQQAQGTLVRELVAKASNDASRDPLIGRTLFDLLVPVEMEPFLGGTSEMVLELDGGTAVIPWELLETPGSQMAGGDPRPWAIRSKLLRKLRTARFRSTVADAGTDGSVLVIGSPLVDDDRYPPLPGARAEAEAVAARFGGGMSASDASGVRALTSGADDARDVINALFERPYRIVHVAGHGAPGPTGGVVLSGGSFLGAAEVEAMRVVPELVFLNCCHLAGRDAATALVPYDRAAFAADIAEALIEIGVRCVVAAGWAVEDGPAELFATTFYDRLLVGERFIDAVAAARDAAWRASGSGNTWAAYQCYGDPNWTYREPADGAVRRVVPPNETYASVSSAPALALALETLSIQIRFGGDAATRPEARQTQRDRVRFLEARFAPLWGSMGAVAEAFGLAFGDIGDLDQAIAWDEAAVQANDGSASFRAAEHLARQLIRRGEAAPDARRGRADIEAAIDRLGALVAVHRTAEREALLGSAFKAIVTMEAGRKGDGAALRAMALHYGNAERLAAASGAVDLFASARHGIGAELRLAFLERRPAELALERIAAVRASLERAAADRPDFWTAIGLIELRLLAALAAGRLAGDAAALVGDLRALHDKLPGPDRWRAVEADARFTVEPYLRMASAAEKKAALALLDAVQAMASAG